MVQYDVFLSHNSQDKDIVEKIAHRLRVDKLEPFLDKWHLIPGSPWQEELEEALDNSKTVAIFIGPHDISPWENNEMRVALNKCANNKDYRVIPILLPNAVKPEGIPHFLSQFTWVDLRRGLDDEVGYRRLLSGIRGEVPGPGIAITEIDKNLLAELSHFPNRTEYLVDRPEQIDEISRIVLGENNTENR